MKAIISYLKKETVLTISLVVAILSMFFVRPDKEYISYINYSVLALLFCLMMVVAGMKKANLFTIMLHRLLGITNHSKGIILIFVSITFFGAMFVTNDVMLLTIVPITLGLFGKEHPKELIFAVVMETIAANLGSMMTPIGNPQNLYLYDYYQMGLGEFLQTVLPVALLSFGLLVITILCRKNLCLQEEVAEGIKEVEEEKQEVEVEKKETHTVMDLKLDKRRLIVYLVLFLIAICSVLRILDYRICLIITIVAVLAVDRSLFAKVDYALLLTFVAFFLFVGNLARIPWVQSVVEQLVIGHEFFSGLLLSQVISNVPAAVMLSGFIPQTEGLQLLLGVDVGGLGTLVASLASLISYKLYVKEHQEGKGRYFVVFTVYNLVYLVILTGVVTML